MGDSKKVAKKGLPSHQHDPNFVPAQRLRWKTLLFGMRLPNTSPAIPLHTLVGFENLLSGACLPSVYIQKLLGLNRSDKGAVAPIVV